MKGRVWVRYTIIGSAVFLLCLPLLLSQVSKYLLTRQLEARGMTAVSLEKLWINPFNGVASIKALKFSSADKDYYLADLELDLTLTDLWGRKVRVSGIRLADANLTVRQDAAGNLYINSINLTDDSTQEAVEDVASGEAQIEGDNGVTWHFALDNVGVSNVHVVIDLPEVSADLTIEKIAIEKLDTGEDHRGKAELLLQLTNLTLPAAETEVALALDFRSELELERLGEQDWSLSADSRIRISDLSVAAPQVAMQLPETRIEVDSQATFGEAGWSLQAKSQTEFTELAVSAAQAAVKSPKTLLQLDVDGKSEGTGPVIAAHTSVTLTELDVKAPQVQVNALETVVTLQADARLGETTSYQAATGMTMASVAVKDAATAAQWLELQRLALTSDFDGSTLTVTELLMSGLDLLPAEAVPTLVKGAEFQLQGMVVTLPAASNDESVAESVSASASEPAEPRQAPGVVIDSLSLPRANLTFLRDKQGETPQLAALLSAGSNANGADSDMNQDAATRDPAVHNPAANQPDDQAEVQSSSEEAVVPVLIKKITIGPDVTAKISDQGVEPAFVEKLQLNALELTDVSLTDTRLPARLLLDLGLSNDATVKAEGQFNVASMSADLELAVEGYQLLSLSGYSSQFTGYALESGVFGLTSSVKVTDNVMDTKNQAIINHITLRPEHAGQAEKFAHQLTMPLDQALDLLRDSNDQIKLDVPVKGALNDPDVDIQQVINKALGGAMKKASMLVLKSLLQPYGAIITVAQMAGEKMTEVRLDPIVFDAGSVALNAVAKDYSAKIAAMVNDRETLTLKLCGVTNPDDAQWLVAAAGEGAAKSGAVAPASGEAAPTAQSEQPSDPQSQQQLQLQQNLQQGLQQQRERLNQLGSDRTQAVKQYLQTQLKVKPGQLLVCLPEHRDKAGAPGGVVLSI